ncbi:MAG: DUF3127 domain-containing protein [Bacteroidota bacterium]|nr:DUF3127 domain-containing protein [Bacteroidota bacterium]
MKFELSGKIIVINDTKQISDKFKKREFVILRKEMVSSMEFTDYIKFQLIQDKCNLIDSYKVNDEVKVSFNIRGNKWERDGNVNYFTNLDAWRLEKAGESENPPPPPPMQEQDDVYVSNNTETEDDDLPF